MQERKVFIGYEYKEITVPVDQISMYLDCYENFGWIAPYFVFQHMTKEKKKKYNPLIGDKLEEIYQICEKGHSLL